MLIHQPLDLFVLKDSSISVLIYEMGLHYNLCHSTKHIYWFCEVFLILLLHPSLVSLIDSAAFPA